MHLTKERINTVSGLGSVSAVEVKPVRVPAVSAHVKVKLIAMWHSKTLLLSTSSHFPVYLPGQSPGALADAGKEQLERVSEGLRRPSPLAPAPGPLAPRRRRQRLVFIIVRVGRVQLHLVQGCGVGHALVGSGGWWLEGC